MAAAAASLDPFDPAVAVTVDGAAGSGLGESGVNLFRCGGGGVAPAGTGG
jgi:hypothetical protein